MLQIKSAIYHKLSLQCTHMLILVLLSKTCNTEWLSRSVTLNRWVAHPLGGWMTLFYRGYLCWGNHNMRHCSKGLQIRKVENRCLDFLMGAFEEENISKSCCRVDLKWTVGRVLALEWDQTKEVTCSAAPVHTRDAVLSPRGWWP